MLQYKKEEGMMGVYKIRKMCQLPPLEGAASQAMSCNVHAFPALGTQCIP